MSTKPLNLATTVKIRKDRHGNAYMAHDAHDDLTDGATLVYSGRTAETFQAIYDALDLVLIALARDETATAKSLVRTILATRRK